MVVKKTNAVAVPNVNKGLEKITVITRDNIRTLKPLGEAAIKKKQSNETLKVEKKKVVMSPIEETLEAVNANVNKSKPVTVPIDNLHKVKTLSTFLSKEELEAKNHEANQARLDIIAQAKARKAKLEEYDHKRSANEKLSELEKEAKDKANYLLSKAKLQLEEQEDDIKHLNELMLYAKCVVIRDAQIDEKKLIQRAKKEEDERLDHLMELERQADLKKLAEREKKRVEELRKGAAKIREQISERREAAMLDQERRDQETKQTLKHIAEVNELDRKEKVDKILAQRSLMQEVVKANNESAEYKKLQKLKEEEEDKKVLQYLLDKEQREIENDRLLQQKKVEREKDLARLRALQEKMSDKQAQQDALRAQRAYEAHEREWRRKEKEAAEKHAAQENGLKEDRIKQQKAREHAIAVEAHKMRLEFMDNIKRQKEIELKIQEEEKIRAQKNKVYSTEVKTQITEKEAIRRKEREDFFMEGMRLNQERKENAKRIDSIKERKLTELQQAGVPEKYCKEIRRNMAHSQKSKFSK